MAPPHGKRSRVEKSQASRKKHRTNNAPAKPRKALTAGQFVPPDKLQWKEVELPDQLEDAEGFFGLEEIDDVEVVRNEKDVTVQYRVGKPMSSLQVDEIKLRLASKLAAEVFLISMMTNWEIRS